MQSLFWVEALHCLLTEDQAALVQSLMEAALAEARLRSVAQRRG